MKTQIISLTSIAIFLALGSFVANLNAQSSSPDTPSRITSTARVVSDTHTNDVVIDENIQLCQGFDNVYGTPGCQSCGGSCGGTCGGGVVAAGGVDMGSGFGYGTAPSAAMPTRMAEGFDSTMHRGGGGIAGWRNSGQAPWEQFSYGEYIGPHRTPHVPVYRLRVNDQLEFVYLRTREKSLQAYQLFVGDQISVSSAIDPSLTQAQLIVRSDGMVSLSLIGQVQAAGKTVDDLQRELNDKYTKYVKNPAIVVQVTQGDTPLQDLAWTNSH